MLGLAVWADVPLARATWAWHAAYLSNVYIALEGQWQGHLSHFWSLAVEEQFYLVWPWLIVIAPARWLGPIVAGAVLLGPLARAAAAWWGLPEPFWALVPGGSADSLGLGAWLALDRWRRPDGVPIVGRSAAAAAALVVWVALAAADDADAAAAGAGGMAAGRPGPGLRHGSCGTRCAAADGCERCSRIPRWSTSAASATACISSTRSRRSSSTASPAGLGADGMVPAGPLARAGLYAVTTLALAALMWRLVEQPVLALKARVPYVSAASSTPRA